MSIKITDKTAFWCDSCGTAGKGRKARIDVECSPHRTVTQLCDACLFAFRMRLAALITDRAKGEDHD